VGITIPDSDLTRSFDAKLRKASLEDLLARVLRARAATEPVVIVLEDCHWIDELSRDLLEVLTRAATGLRLVFVLAYRPAEAVGGGLGIDRLPNFEEIALDRLDDADAAEVVRSKLEQVAGRGEVPSAELVDLVTERADGNPLYIEELVSFIASQRIDSHDRAAMKALQLPESLQALILSRMDTVAEDARRSMKVASVIGRVFEAPMLPGAYPELGPLDDVLGHLETLKSADLVLLDREADLAYLFKHVTTQEVAYGSMPFGMRSMLHRRVGEYIETSEPEAVERNLDLLAHHYWLGDDEAKKVEYLGRAAEAAVASYANQAAIVYYERLLALVDGANRVAVTLKLAAVLQRVGDLSRSERIVVEARDIAVELDDPARVARCDLALAEIARRLGRYVDAWSRLTTARRALSDADDDEGLAEALHLAGSVSNQSGDRAAARDWYGRSLEIRERIGDLSGMARLSINLGIVAGDEGDIPLAREFYERSVALYRELGDRRGLGMGESNLAWLSMLAGQPAAARAHSEEAVRLAREVGDRLNLAIGQHNLGNALRELRQLELAGPEYAAAAQAYQELDDRWGLAYLLEDVALLAVGSSIFEEGFRLLGAANALRAEIGAPRSSSAEAELTTRLSKARATLGDLAAAAEAHGARLGLDVAVAVAVRVACPGWNP
jgi:tetratricopeptide (TPR) repeat protein